jgi:GTP-binding protein EngB required for normal cell division
MAYDEEVYEKLLGNFNLLCSIIRQNSCGEQLKVDLSKIEEVINKKIPDTLKKHAPEDFYELYTDFKSEYEKFRDFILYDKLIGKNIVALGGGFSSGKSSFLNALMGKTVLPADIDPSTSVPTYIVRGDKHEVMGINVFDAKVQMQPRDIKKIAHGFGEVEDDEDEKITDAVTLGHILENIFFSTPLHTYDSIAFLDTPGYSKPDSEKYSAKTDANIARGQLNSSNYILWFVQADAGTITEEDIKFIKTLRTDIPKLIIVNKADKKNLVDLKDIIAKIKTNLDIKGIRYVDVFAFTSKSEQIEDEKLKKFIEVDAGKIKKQIETWNSQIYESNFAKNFKLLFVRCKEFYEKVIDEESKKLTRLNTSITKLAAEDINFEILEPLQLMVKEAQKKVNEVKDISGKLKDLQDEFFTEIKFISDVVGISMPEPSEIDLIQDKIKNPLQLIEEYKKENGIKTDSSVVDMLQDVFDGIEPVINKSVVGSEYRNELIDVIMETCNVNAKDIHINDVYKNTEEYTGNLTKAMGENSQ